MILRILVLSMLILPGAAFAGPDDNWSTGYADPLHDPAGLGMNSDVLAFVENDGALIGGGEFYRAGGVWTFHVAKRTVSGWDPVGAGVGTALNDNVRSFLRHAGTLVAAINRSPFILSYDGTTWTAMDSGLPTGVFGARALAEYQGALYAGFDVADDPTEHLHRWNGNTWETLPDGGVSGPVTALAVFDGELYVAGDFNLAGGVFVRNIAAFDGNSWRKLGAGLAGGLARALHVHEGNLIVGGEFVSAGSVVASGLAGYDGSAWFSLGPGISGPSISSVHSLGTYNGRLIAGGRFDAVSGVSAANIAAWDGAAWEPLGSGVGPCGGAGPCYEPFVEALIVFDGSLYVGGTFRSAGTKSSSRVAQWTESATGVDPFVPRVAVSAAFPNPFRTGTRISITSPGSGPVRAVVLDLRGRVIRTLGSEAVGTVSGFVWDGRDDGGAPLASGTYFIRVAWDGGATVRKVLRLP